MTHQNFRKSIVVAARKWIGTPYTHQASVCGIGTDCLGLVRGIWRELIGKEPQEVPDYSPDWGEVSQAETMLEAADKWFHPIGIEKADYGDLILFRWKNAAVVRHAGILTGKNNFIHAYEKAGVVETTLGSQWRKRIVSAHRFPEIKPDR